MKRNIILTLAMEVTRPRRGVAGEGALELAAGVCGEDVAHVVAVG